MILINPPSKQGYPFPSLGLLSIAAVLRKNGFKVNYIDINFDNQWKKKVIELSKTNKIFGITSNVLTIEPALRISEFLKNNIKGATVIFGGHYPSAEYKKLPQNLVDISVIGEGEKTALEIAKGKELNEINGIFWRDNGTEKLNKCREVIHNLDDLPFPAWDLGYFKKVNLPHNKNNPTVSIMTMRGCFNRCMYCSSFLIHRNVIRFHSVDWTIECIEYLYKIGVREIHIVDDNFTLDVQRVKNLCKQIIKRNFKDLFFAIPSGIRPDLGDREMFELMAKSNFYSICFAIETYNTATLLKAGKKVDISYVNEKLKWLDSLNITSTATFMIGLPFENEKIMKKSINFALSLPLDQALFFIAIPLPGTDLYSLIVKKGKFLYNECGYFKTGFFIGKATFELPELSAKTIENIYKLGYRKFYIRFSIVVRFLKKRVFSPAHFFRLIFKAFLVLIKGKQF